MVKNYSVTLFTVLIIFVGGCSSQIEPPKYFQKESNFRSLANIENIFSPEEYLLHACFEKIKSDCFTQHAFIEVGPQDDIYKQQLNTKKMFHGCVLDEAITCSYQASSQKYIERLNQLKKEFLIGDNLSYLNWTKLRKYDAKEIFDLHYDLAKISRLFNDKKSKNSFQGFSIDNRDLVAIPVGFQGVALHDSDQVTMYCRSQLSNDLALGSHQRKYYKSSQCEGPIKLAGQRLLLMMDNGSEVIFEFNFGRFARQLAKLNEKESLNLHQASRELESISNKISKRDLSLELLVANHILPSDPKLSEMYLELGQLTSLPRKVEFQGGRNLNLLLKVIGDTINKCVLHTTPNSISKGTTIKRGLYIVNYGAFANIHSDMGDSLFDSNKIELLHPFLLNEQKLLQVQQVAEQSQKFNYLIRKNCTSKNAVELNINFIQDEIF